MFFLDKWTQRQYASYPILYLAYHGAQGEIFVNERGKRSAVVSLDELEEELEDACDKRLIHFGSCDTLMVHGKTINRFLARTQALAVCGYRGEVDPLLSAAFELLVFDVFQRYSLTANGARAMKRDIFANCGKLARKLKFHMATR